MGRRASRNASYMLIGVNNFVYTPPLLLEIAGTLIKSLYASGGHVFSMVLSIDASASLCSAL